MPLVGYPPTQRVRRSGSGARVRRWLLLSAGVAALCVLGLVLFVFPTTHHVKVVRVVRTDPVGPQITSTPSLPEASAGVQPGRKPVYEEEPGAPATPAGAAGSATGTAPVAHSALPSGATASFHVDEQGLSHQRPMPDVPPPENLEPLAVRLEPYREAL